MTGPRELADWFVSRSFSGGGGKKADWQAAGVRWATESDSNHAGLFVGDIDGVPSVFEAMPGGARTAPLSVYQGDNVTWSNGFGINGVRGQERRELQERLVATALKLTGLRYGWGDVIAAGLAQRRLGGRVNLRKPLAEQPWYVRRLIDRDTADCSQILVRIFRANGVDLFLDGRHEAFVTPGDLSKLLRDEVRPG